MFDDPAGLLSLRDYCERSTARLAIDDAGVSPESLAVLPILEPAVIKLDMGLIQREPTVAIADVVSAVNAHAQRTGAVILAEGVETPEQERLAIAMGATLGQGWLYGRPEPMTATNRPASGGPGDGLELPQAPDGDGAGSTPFELIDPRDARPSTPPLLTAMSRFLEDKAAKLGPAALVLAAMQDAPRFTPALRERYRDLARGCALAAVLARGLDGPSWDGVRTGGIADGDPLAREWAIVVLAPDFAGALMAQEMEPQDDERSFRYRITYDRGVVSAAARRLLARLPRR